MRWWFLLVVLLWASAAQAQTQVVLMCPTTTPGTGPAFVLCATGGTEPPSVISQTTPGTTNGVNINPTSAATAAITPVVSAAVESNHVLKASAGNLWSVYVSNATTAGFLMIFNATSAPADGAVTPIHCVPVAADSFAAIDAGSGPAESYATGITAVFSTTGCFTKTASATAFFHGSVE